MSAELLSDWGPLVALAGLLWRWTVNMDKRLARFEAKTGKRMDALEARMGSLEQRVARIEGLIEGLFRPADAPAPASTGD